MKTAPDETQPAAVPERATQAGEAILIDWDWVERQVWTERMLEALEKGVKGGVWFSLIDTIQRPKTLVAAWLAVKRNGGSAGTDHQSIEDFEKDLAEEIERLSEALRTGSYRPRPIRRVYIDKPGSSEKRPLGIPTVSAHCTGSQDPFGMDGNHSSISSAPTSTIQGSQGETRFRGADSQPSGPAGRNFFDRAGLDRPGGSLNADGCGPRTYRALLRISTETC